MSSADIPPNADTLPVPPLRLRRIRLHGVGPDGARFDPLDLDFATAAGAASRVLMSLTNTGGKSTLITLVSSLVIPASRAQVGGKNLGDYVLTGDTSHVVCEWEDATTGVRTVIGTVMEWKDGRRQPGHKNRSTTNMYRAWYLFRTGPGLPGIEDLPFVTDGRRTIFDTYIKAVDGLVSQYPDAQWVLARSQQDWTRTLEERTNIDPVLFGYQMRMNDAEAGAEKLLTTFDSPDNVVRFFVAALNDDREIVDFTNRLGTYATLAAKRPFLQALHGFCAAVGPCIELVAGHSQAVDEAAAAAVRARIQGGEHAGALHNRLEQDRATLADLETDVREAGRRLTTARREYGQISDIRLQLQLEEARARRAAAAADVMQKRSASEEAASEARAWEAVDIVLEVARRRAERDSAKTAYDTAEAGLGPLRARVASAAARLAGRLDGLTEEARLVAEGADSRVRAARGEWNQALGQENDASKRRDDAKRELQEIDDQSRAAEQAAAAAVDAGWLAVGELPNQCLRRWQDARGNANQLAEQEQDQADLADKKRNEIDSKLEAADRQLTGLRSTAQAAQNRLDAFDVDRAVIAADEVVQSLLGDPPQSAADLSRAGTLAQQAARDADRRAAEHERVAHTARDELAHLDETGTAPTGADVLAVLSALHEEPIGAVTGLEWIEHNIVDPEARPIFIAAHPDIAGGVVVSDQRRFGEAVDVLNKASPRTRTPIAVTTAQSVLDAPGGADQHRHVVVPQRATWDRDWAAQTRADLAQIVATEGSVAAQARQAAEAHRTASAACTGFVDRWKETTRQDLAHDADSAASDVAAAERRRNELRSERDRQRDVAREARNRAGSARQEADRPTNG